MKKAVLIIAHKDFRDDELNVPMQILQDNGIECKIASTSLDTAVGSLGIKISPDITVKDIDADDYDVIIVVGGPGAPELAEHKEVLNLLRSAESKGKNIAAICISSTILAKAGVLKGKRATVWKSDESIRQLEQGEAIFEDKPVVVEDKLITANGPAAAKEFAEKIVDMLKGG